jgi:hypothetical protein
MYTEYFRCDYGGNRKAVEHIDKSLPRLDVASPLAFVVKSVNSGDVGAFMVAT